MANAYSSPERTAAYMKHLEENHELIMKLRDEMSNVETPMEDCVLAFTKLYKLYNGDPFQQQRLIVNLEFTAKRHQPH